MVGFGRGRAHFEPRASAAEKAIDRTLALKRCGWYLPVTAVPIKVVRNERRVLSRLNYVKLDPFAAVADASNHRLPLLFVAAMRDGEQRLRV